MKKDIYSLGDKFSLEISECKSEEDYVRRMEEDYKKALSTLQSNNEKRIKEINEIRLSKIKEIGAEYEKCELELKELRKKVDDDKSLSKDGKTYRILQEEFLKLTQYINYLYLLKSKLCELFGHDAKMISDYEDFECKCCGKTMSYREYINSHHKAKYRGIVEFYYRDLPESEYIISSIGEDDLSLPTFENYQKSLELEQKQTTVQDEQTTAQEEKDKPKKLTKRIEPWPFGNIPL